MIALRFLTGVLLTVNFLLFWAVPIAVQGLLWKHLCKRFLQPVYDVLEAHKGLRDFAATYVYSNPRHADFFVTALLILASSIGSLAAMFYIQLTTGSLPWYAIAAYYFAWVGLGGRMMGAAYTFAHKEGHNHNLYKKWIKNSVGNFFENIMGVWFGNVPYNFTTSHIVIHHRLDGGVGDTFYQWDLDRSSLYDFMLYMYRILQHMTGYSSLRFFYANNFMNQFYKLVKGCVIYHVLVPAAILYVTRSWSFLFWMYYQPLCCMAYFLAFLNFAFHGFIEFDENGVNIPCVNSTAIIEGDDDYFGEDDHMAHHYATTVYFKDLPDYQKTQLEAWKKHHASVFRSLSIVELAIFIIFGLWDKLAEHYVDYSGKLSKEEIAKMLEVRAKRKEMSYDEYEAFLLNPIVRKKRAGVAVPEADKPKRQ